jgi:hypothetical protein
MKTLLADLAAKSSPEGRLTIFKHWLFVRRELVRYALAPVAVAIAFLARALTPILGDASPYLLFVPAVLVAAGLGGLGPGTVSNWGQRCARLFRRHHFSPPNAARNRQCMPYSQ